MDENLTPEEILKQDYSNRFDELRKGSIVQSRFKYGKASRNFPDNVDAMATIELQIAKYQETGNKDYLLDIANYAMFEFMYPKHKNAHFRRGSSDESAGLVGMSVGEMQAFKNGIR